MNSLWKRRFLCHFLDEIDSKAAQSITTFEKLRGKPRVASSSREDLIKFLWEYFEEQAIFEYCVMSR